MAAVGEKTSSPSESRTIDRTGLLLSGMWCRRGIPGLIKIPDGHKKHGRNLCRIRLYCQVALEPDNDRTDSKARTGRKIIQLTNHAGTCCIQAEFFPEFTKRCTADILPIINPSTGQSVLAPVPGEPTRPPGQRENRRTAGWILYKHNGHSGRAQVTVFDYYR
ncbi:MAG: hypothetical protein Ct9H300mP16_16990 [Pseudomonadota bacterium]|nr:MAG: hypothetical protein Ct9H300mP16_16990 [Pseudomonadota bacterium]